MMMHISLKSKARLRNKKFGPLKEEILPISEYNQTLSSMQGFALTYSFKRPAVNIRRLELRVRGELLHFFSSIET